MQVFTILRYDATMRADTPLPRRIKVTKVVLSEDYAQEEVQRLNQMNAARGIGYFAQATQLDDSHVPRNTG
jgi:hypothetical protein